MQAFTIEYPQIEQLYSEMLLGQVAPKTPIPALNISESLGIFISRCENIVDSDLQTLEEYIRSTTQ